MKNNPVRYNDPTGHKTCGDGEEHSCNGKKQDPNEDPNVDDEVSAPDPDPNSELENNPVDIDFCAQNPYAAGCSSLLPSGTCEYGSISSYGNAIPSGCYLAGYHTYVDWNKVDYLDLFVNVLQIIGGVALFAGALSIIAAPVGIGIYAVASTIGLAYDIAKLDYGAITLDTIGPAAKMIGVDALEKIMAPIGFAVSWENLLDTIDEAKITEPVYSPYYQKPMILPQ